MPSARSLRPAKPLDQYAMAQPLIEDRFKLKWRWGKKDAPVYIVTASARGLKVSPTARGSCRPFDEKAGRRHGSLAGVSSAAGW